MKKEFEIKSPNQEAGAFVIRTTLQMV